MRSGPCLDVDLHRPERREAPWGPGRRALTPFDAPGTESIAARATTMRPPPEARWKSDEPSRGGGIRTHDLNVPNVARCQAALRPDSIHQRF